MSQPELIWIWFVAFSVAAMVMFYGLNIMYKSIKAKGQGFGASSLKTIGVVLLIPTILILAVLTRFQAGTLATLLDGVARYVLSKRKPKD